MTSQRLPDIRIGDQWVFVTRTQEEIDQGRPGLIMRNTVADIGADGRIHVEVQRTNGAADAPTLRNVYNRQFDLLSREIVPGEAIDYQPAFPQFQFPLTIGKTWRETVTQIQPAWDLRSAMTVSVIVEAEERITVPAGTFHTIRLGGHYTAPQATVMTKFWYAPAAGRAIKGIEDTLSINGVRTQLIYELQSLNRLRAV